jgi:type IV secretory pathway TraG/TraD family ATPase VirD4
METNQPEINVKGALVVVGCFFGTVLTYKIHTLIQNSIWWRSLFWIILAAIVAVAGFWGNWLFEKRQKENDLKKSIYGKTKDSVYCGITTEDMEVHVKPWQRSMHTQVIGTTNAGKTESVILPWAIQDIKQGRGLILIDGKADRSLLDRLWSFVWLYDAEDRFRLFSLSSIRESHTFNPLIGGSPEEISERVFNSFEFTDEYYRSVQFEVFSQVMRIFERSKQVPTFKKIHQALSNPNDLCALVRNIDEKPLQTWADWYRDLPNKDREQRVSGLLASISHFAFGEAAVLFNAEKPSFTIEESMSKNRIIYFQLPVLRSPFLGKAAGKMILQCIQSAIANRHRSENRNPNFFSIFLDDFSEYLYPGFVSILNKSRSANIGVVFAHQALGDIKTLGDAIANSILTNANIKVFMRGNDPDSAEYFSRVIGTEKSIKYTERTKKELLTQNGTGEASAREVDEFTIHPNMFKRELGVGEAMVLIPHTRGTKVVHLRFKKYDEIEARSLPSISKESPQEIIFQENNPIQEAA